MDEFNRYRNAILVVAATAIALWLISDWLPTLDLFTDPTRWLLSLSSPRPL